MYDPIQLMSNITKIAPVGLFSNKASALDLKKAIFSLCFYMDFSLCVDRWGLGGSLVPLPFIRSYKGLSPI